MSKEIEAKLDVLAAMNSALGKVANVQVRLELAGEEELAKKADTKRKALLKEIQILQGHVADQWTMKAATIEKRLREANGKVQTRTRNIKNKVNVAKNAIAILGQIDEALAFLKTVVKAMA
jgi:hypothetical protein